VAIQGTGWPDVTKMRSAGLRVETMEWHPNMHKLVSDGIVDYYPRSVLEVIDELHSINNPHLIIEQNLLLSYDLLNYFFVAKDNLSLAKRIKIGLQKSMEDGSFDTYFKQYPGHSDALDLLNNRRIFDLEKGRTATNN
jgi:membrane-bound lytic murein transglycosylase MltF